MSKSLLNIFILGSCLCFLTGCDYLNVFRNNNVNKSEKKLARVNRTYLLESNLPKGITDRKYNSPKDSIKVLSEYKDNWVYHQLMMQKAKDFLPKDNISEIEHKISEYAGSIFAYEYEKELVNQKVNLEVNPEQIQSYYDENINSFGLSHNIVNGRYFFMDNNVAQADSIKKWFKNMNGTNFKKLEAAGFQIATNFNLKGQWLPFDQFQAKLPERIKNPEKLKKNNFLELGDSNRTCLVWIEDVRFKGETSPVEYIEQDIRKIIVNKRKQSYLKRIKNNIYNEAKNTNAVEIY